MKRVLFSTFICVGIASLIVIATCRSAAADVSWSMVILPDTQAASVTEWNAMTQWIFDNKDSRNIQVVVGTGDIVQGNTASQWVVAKTAMSILDNEVPYILPVGNHDLGTNGNANDLSTKYSDYFALGDNSLNSSSLGIMTTERITGELQNTYSTFTAPDGRNMLIFSLEFGPRQSVVDWANGIAGQPQYENYTAVLATHAYLEEGPADAFGQPTPLRSDWATFGASRLYNPHSYPEYFGNINTSLDPVHDGQELWDELVGVNGNFEMVFNGHYADGTDDDFNSDPFGGKLATAYQESVGTEGNTVHEMLFNAQWQGGGNGYLRLLEFLDDCETVQVRTYSPTRVAGGIWLTDQNNEFQIVLSSIPEPATGLLLVIGFVITAGIRSRKWQSRK